MALTPSDVFAVPAEHQVVVTWRLHRAKRIYWSFPVLLDVSSLPRWGNQSPGGPCSIGCARHQWIQLTPVHTSYQHIIGNDSRGLRLSSNELKISIVNASLSEKSYRVLQVICIDLFLDISQILQ